jgi:small basic protein (TIGR04137 family)
MGGATGLQIHNSRPTNRPIIQLISFFSVFPLPPKTPALFSTFPLLTDMTQHNSFKSSASSAGAKRNVLKRFERVELLKKRGALKDIKRVTKLPKTKPEA